MCRRQIPRGRVFTFVHNDTTSFNRRLVGGGGRDGSNICNDGGKRGFKVGRDFGTSGLVSAALIAFEGAADGVDVVNLAGKEGLFVRGELGCECCERDLRS